MRLGFIAIILLVAQLVCAQESADTVHVLHEVTVNAYSYARPPLDVPVSVGLVDATDLKRFTSMSVLPALNTIAGVRMEERSPGSYRLAIRGSSLRSPFGIRNVKVYWNNLPLTDASGNTYLNQLDPNVIGHVEVIKGPGSSLYGAGTGGVLLITGKRADSRDEVRVNVSTGSYGQRNYNASYIGKTQTVQYNHQHTNGYRQYSSLTRDQINWQGTFSVHKRAHLSAALFAADLYYQTPGALTKSEWNEDPRQARPGADQRDPHVHAASVWSGLVYSMHWNNSWETTAGVYGNYVDFENASFRNYEERYEKNAGARSVTTYRVHRKNISNVVTFGGEWQAGLIPSRVYSESGPAGVLQQQDKFSSVLYSFFLQCETTLSHGWSVTAGTSYTGVRYRFTRYSDNPVTHQRGQYTPEWSPRIAVLKKLGDHVSLFASVSRGFSPPSYAEVYPSAGVFNKQLAAEQGYNFEAGIKTLLLNKNLLADFTVYDFEVDHAIVLRRTPDNAEYFVNAGGTHQRGAEVMLSYSKEKRFVGYRIWLSLALQHFRFYNYQQGSQDYSGNKLTGTPTTLGNAGIDLSFLRKLKVSLTSSYTGKIPLDDANASFANSYLLVGAKLSYETGRYLIYSGVDNLLNRSYSLGNDLNTFGGRYYNVAPTRNFQIGIQMRLMPALAPGQ